MARVLITGAAGSIGKELVRHFLRRDDEVVGLDLEPADPADGIDSENLEFRRCDVTVADQVESVVRDRGPFDIVVNSAAIIHSEPLIRLESGVLVTHDFAEWRKVVDVTLTATFYVTAICARSMMENRRHGVIINLGSVCASGNPGQVAYSAAKAGVNGLTRTLGKELGPLGIRVVAISPGFFDTESTRASVDEKTLAGVKNRVPVRRLGDVEELLRAVDFVIATEYFNGRILELDGGLTL